MFKVPHRHKIPLRVKRREMTTKLCEKRKVIFWMMVESNLFSRAAEGVITRVESRAMSQDAHGELGPELAGKLPRAQSWSWMELLCAGSSHPAAGRRLKSEKALPGEGWGPPSLGSHWQIQSRLVGSVAARSPWKPSQRHLLGPSAWKIGTVLLSGGKETDVCVIATPH